MSEDKIVEIPNMPDSICFACGPANDKGLRMKFYGSGNIVFCNIAVPDYMVGWNNIVHGGVLSTLLDEGMSWGAIFLLKKYIFTKTMTVNYHKPVPVEEMLRIESEVKERISDREAVMAARIINSKGEMCVSSTGTFSLMDRDYVKKLGFIEEKEIDFYWEMFNSFHEPDK